MALVETIGRLSASEDVAGETDSLQSKIQRWLADTFAIVVAEEDSGTIFKLRISPNPGDFVYVVQFVGASDRLDIVVGLDFGAVEQDVVGRLSVDRQHEIKHEVWRELSRFDIQFSGGPETGSLRCSTWLFVDALTKDELFRRMLMVYRAVSIARALYSREFDRLVRRSGNRQQRRQAATPSWFGGQWDPSNPFPMPKVAMAH